MIKKKLYSGILSEVILFCECDVLEGSEFGAGEWDETGKETPWW